MSEEKKHPGGRPREYDREELAKKLLEWSLRDDAINLNAFCGKNKIPPSYITRWAREDVQFCEAYEEAKANLGVRREQKLAKGELHVKAYDLNAKVYDHFLKHEHRENFAYETTVKSNANIQEQKAASASEFEHWQKLKQEHKNG